ncbi:sialate O-acetylesterase [Prosthecobacter sp.]|uniref:sialate O-acetylesterase n=1 Tax=Prosthecobacter sp. TaxID=1965333 RepID=UPI001D66119A|nr:sialate O-acetylesterase [Prosthecobacter sp.]MCB1278130.1 sialate O-acetylesterase [Prosthecobacter sp.]
MNMTSLTRRRCLTLAAAALIAPATQAQNAKKKKSGKASTPPPTKPPLQPVDITKLPEGTEELDLFLLIGQSNMKGRGVMPDEPKRDPRIVMMHLKDDSWYLARHPLHLTGDAKTFAGHDNAGVGSGLAFAETITAQNPKIAVGLIPCAVGGSPIQAWQKGAKLYDEALRRAKLALQVTAPVKARIRGALWLQGEANANPEGLAVHEGKLLKLVDDLRADLSEPDLPFIACTIGEMGDPEKLGGKAAMNKILLDLPSKRPHTACVDARDLKTHIGDNVHFDTAAQNEIGKRFAAKYSELTKQ